MKRAVALIALSACFDFDGRLAQCRDAGVWICGASSAGGGQGGGATSSGGGQGGGATGGGVDDVGDGGLLCSGGWCWENPRPAGVSLVAVAARAANDVWVAGDHAYAGHWNGTVWVSHPLPFGFDPKSLCFEGNDLYVAGAPASGVSVMVFRGGEWAPVGFDQPVTQMRCAPGQLLLAFQNDGAGRLDLNGGQPLIVHNPLPGETCTGIVERPDGGCTIACQPSPSSSTLYDCSGGVEWPSDGGSSSGTVLGAMWLDDTRGPMVTAIGPGAVWWKGDGGWQPFQSFAFDPTGGASSSGGSFVVGSAWAVLPVLGSPREYASFGAQLRAVSTDVGGTAWATGDDGVIVKLELAGNLNIVSPVPPNGFYDVSIGTRALAAGNGGTVFERGLSGWQNTFHSGSADYLAIWELPDASYAVQSSQTIEFEHGDTINFSDVVQSRIAVLDPNTVLAPGNTALWRIDLGDGSHTSEMTGMILHVCADELGNAFATTQAGAWMRDDAGWRALDGGPSTPTDLSCLAGTMWTLSGAVAWQFKGGTWSQVSTTTVPTHIVAIDATRAIAFAPATAVTNAVLVDSTTLTVLQLADAPATLYRARFIGGDVWVMGSPGAILRFHP
jgi:hypothetical protein